LLAKKRKILGIKELNENSDKKNNKYQIYKELIAEYYSFLKQLRRQFLEKYGDNHKFPKFRWEKSYHDHYIRNHKDFEEHLKYIYDNPAKHLGSATLARLAKRAEAGQIPDPENYEYIYTNYSNLIDEF